MWQYSAGRDWELYYGGKGPRALMDRVVASADSRREVEAYLLLATGMALVGTLADGLKCIAGQWVIRPRSDVDEESEVA